MLSNTSSHRSFIMRILRPGYSYTVRKSKTDLQAVIQISARLFRRFVSQCGAINTIAKPGLTVAYQGGGHYLVFTVNDAKSPMVTEFLARLNRWANRVSGLQPFADSLILSSAQVGSPYRRDRERSASVSAPSQGTNAQIQVRPVPHYGPMAFAWNRMLNTHFVGRSV